MMYDCVKCGKCIPKCTIYNVNKDQITTPRAYLNIISLYKNKQISINKDIKNAFDSCFLCLECVKTCPFNLKIDKDIIFMKEQINKKFKIPFYKKMILYLLSNRKILDLFSKFGFILQSCFKNDEKIFKIPLIKKERFMPSLNKKSFLNSNNIEFINNDGKLSIGFFVGCFLNYFYTKTSFDVLNVFKNLKINVHLLKKQQCCGVAHFYNGDIKSALKLAKKNIDYFDINLKNLDYIIIPESTCSSMIRLDYEYIFKTNKENEYLDKFLKIKHRIFLLSDFLNKFTNLNEILKSKQKTNITFTYHHPCHGKAQGIYKENINFLKNNYDFMDINDESCCGFGGLGMQVENFDKSLFIANEKYKNIQKTKASIISAECSACKMQIENVLKYNKSNIIFKHPIELINEALNQ